MSWKAEVVADGTGTFVGNALRFETEEEAKLYVRDLEMRWLAVRDSRTVECDDPVTDRLYRNEGGQLVHETVGEVHA